MRHVNRSGKPVKRFAKSDESGLAVTNIIISPISVHEKRHLPKPTDFNHVIKIFFNCQVTERYRTKATLVHLAIFWVRSRSFWTKNIDFRKQNCLKITFSRQNRNFANFSTRNFFSSQSIANPVHDFFRPKLDFCYLQLSNFLPVLQSSVHQYII